MEAMSADSAETLGWKLLKQGAEARVYSTEFFGQPAIVKERFPKGYRVPALDRKLTHRRMGQEVRSMARCRCVAVPFPYHRWLGMENENIWLEGLKMVSECEFEHSYFVYL